MAKFSKKGSDYKGQLRVVVIVANKQMMGLQIQSHFWTIIKLYVQHLCSAGVKGKQDKSK